MEPVDLGIDIGGGFAAEGAAPPKGQPGCRVYVGNLSWEAAWQELKDHMRGPGGDLEVMHADIMTEPSGRSKGCAIVEYSSPQHAQRAIAELNDTELMGRLIFVREDREDSEGGVARGGGGGGFGGGFQQQHFGGGGYGGRGGGGFRGGGDGGEWNRGFEGRDGGMGAGDRF
mmetsp:Transcript_25272/g.60834  ORF Transcript_25272/g.60834 Transcript_25272/m.60834 type:complete len:172 (+) Transcript_25272:59-574(+)